MSALSKMKDLFRWSYDYDDEGNPITRADGNVNGHDVQVIQQEGSSWCTVFVDGTPAHLPDSQALGHITAKVRR